MTDGLRKVGWVWTKAGWKRIPKRLAAVKKAPMPRKAKKRRPLKIQRIALAEKRQERAAAKASQIAIEQGRAVFAPAPAPQTEKPAPPPPRKAWAGK